MTKRNGTKEKATLTPDTALRLASYLGTSAEYWINWQGLYDLQQTNKRNKDEYKRIEQAA